MRGPSGNDHAVASGPRACLSAVAKTALCSETATVPAFGMQRSTPAPLSTHSYPARQSLERHVWKAPVVSAPARVGARAAKLPFCASVKVGWASELRWGDGC